jgi:hypothetical protein
MSLLRQFICVGCIFSACAKPPPHAKEAQNVVKEFGLQIEHAIGLHSLGSGGFYTNKKVDSFYIDFEIVKNLSEAEAKALLKEVVETLVTFVNQNESVRPYLKNYPISANEISVSIAFIDEKRAPQKELSQIHLFDGVIYYSKFIAEKKEYSPYEQELYITSLTNITD